MYNLYNGRISMNSSNGARMDFYFFLDKLVA
nr:MAG TPA: hypothetical protein [Bacteriophage sp.]